MKKRVLIGVRPTGKLHLGHYVMINKALSLNHDLYTLIADWHALISRNLNIDDMKTYIDFISSCMSSVSKVIIQSEHSEILRIDRILQSYIPMGAIIDHRLISDWKKNNKSVPLALYGYGCLQFADILYINPDIIVVGRDQQVLTRLNILNDPRILDAFRYYDIRNIDGEPIQVKKYEIIYADIVYGSDSRKMSKSYGNCIFLDYSFKKILSGINKYKTDGHKRGSSGDFNRCDAYKMYSTVMGRDFEMEKYCVSGGRCDMCKYAMSANIYKSMDTNLKCSNSVNSQEMCMRTQ